MQQNISKGTVLGERFVIESLENQGDMGQVYKALDSKTKKQVAVRVISVHLLGESGLEHIKARMQQSSALIHRNIRATFGMGIKDDYVFISTEWVDGQNLQTLLKKRTESEKRFSFKGAYNIIGHVCNALSYAHENGCYHGALNPRAIMVNNAGRVKVHDWALSTLRINLKDYPGRQKVEAAYWSPEALKEARSASYRSDIFSLGALFYSLITGRTPQRPLIAPSKLGFSAEVDNIVARCMSADPKQRYKNASEVKQAIKQLASTEKTSIVPPGAVDDDLGITIDVELDLGEDESSVTGGSGMLNAPGLPPLPMANKKDDRASTIDMGAILANASSNDAARWMVQKDKFDHGPFNDRELVQMILLGEVLGNHGLTNMDTGERKPVRSWGEFDVYLERYRLKKQAQDEQEALAKTEKAESRGMLFKLVMAASVLGVIGLVVGGYFLTRTLRKEKQLGPDEMVDALESGEIQLKMGSTMNPGSKGSGKRRGKGKRRSGGGGGAGGGDGREFVNGMSYEEAMNMGVSLGDLSGSGGKKLTAEDINAIMSRNVRKFIPCIAGEHVKRVDMNIAVAGDGRVMGVSVTQGSGKMKSCITQKVRSIKFPTSNQARTATSWYFELY
ncbi:MAG: serine/threonine protein kinase [Deltaproteobacteria bacterium]|nr:serine/threonine protein kinase [Deltaproteobacteria bacterium]